MSVPRPVMLVLSILAALKVFVSAAAVADLIGLTVTGIIVAALAAVDIGVAFYLQGQVVPLKTTVAYVGEKYDIRAGGAAVQPTGSEVRPQVEVGRLTNSEKLSG